MLMSDMCHWPLGRWAIGPLGRWAVGPLGRKNRFKQHLFLSIRNATCDIQVRSQNSFNAEKPMCRLYGFHSSEPTKVECTLVHAQNALLLQSRKDEIGRTHPDGWGIGYYEDDLPMIERNAAAAFHGVHFSNTAERVYSQTVISHVRQATVGTPSISNCHPFSWGGWVFAHNGTVTGIDSMRAEMLSEMTSEHRAAILGDTDSELLFHWLMNRFVRAGVADARECISLEGLAHELSNGIAEIDGRCQVSCPDKPAKLNTVLTDGRIMLASRFRNSLSWVHRDGVRDCEICGIPHVIHSPGKRYRAVVIASEPLSHEDWESIPDYSVITVDRLIRTKVISVPDQTSAAMRT